MSNDVFAPSRPVPGRTRFTTGPLPVLLASALWGTTGTAATYAPASASALSIGAATMGFGGILLCLLAGRSALRVLRSAPVGLLLTGASSIAVYPLAFYSSMALAGVAVGTVVTLGSAPVFAAVVERALDGVRLDGRWALAAAVTVGGGVLLVSDGARLGDAGGAVAGTLLGLLAGLGYAMYSWVAARILRGGHHGSRAVMGAMFGSAALVLLPVFAWTGGPLLSTGMGVAVTAYLAVVPMGLAYVLFGAGLRHTPVRVATTLSLLEPVVAALLGVFVVGERLGAMAWLGMAGIGIGLVLVLTRR
ncbi:EamA family transporter [Saccharopolyspora erythraea]|uniref:DMT family transporter n=1 Tax=Saccharopolyspora erythraea TaxID=1836 RepID=UPI001BA6DD81|nr:EamA family transporter [Saccharopolyspora erythraea]QUG99477.1 EamA family transporter [Saccharopolyspora erythraea]